MTDRLKGLKFISGIILVILGILGFIKLGIYLKIKKEKEEILSNSSVILKMEDILGGNYSINIKITCTDGNTNIFEKQEFVHSGEVKRALGSSDREAYYQFIKKLERDKIWKLTEARDKVADPNKHTVKIQVGLKEHQFSYYGFSAAESLLIFADDTASAVGQARIIEEILSFSREHIHDVKYSDIGANEHGNISLLVNSTDPLGFPILSPDGKYVYFNRIRDYKRYVFRKNLDDNTETQVVEGRLEAVGSLGKYLTFSRDRKLYLHDLERGKSRLISDVWDVDIFFSNVGMSERYVVFARPLDRNNNILKLYDMKTGKESVIHPTGENIFIDISPDQEWIMFFNYNRSDGGRNVFLHNTLTGKLTLLNGLENPGMHPLRFMPDGKSIAYRLNDMVGAFNMDTEKTKVIFREPNSFYQLLSPDASKIFYCVSKGKREMPQRMYRCDRTTGKKIPITIFPLTFFSPDISPHGNRMIFRRFDDLFIWQVKKKK